MWKTDDLKSNIGHECSYAGDATPTVMISRHMEAVIRKMCHEFENSEWQMLIKGDILDANSINITGYYIPKQRVGMATVTNDECITREMCEEKGLIGTIHSHCNMATVFSQTDEEHTNCVPWLKVHIVTNNKGDYDAVMQSVMPCGMTIMREADVIIDEEDVEIEGLDNITVNDYSTTRGFYDDEYGQVGMDIYSKTMGQKVCGHHTPPLPRHAAEVLPQKFQELKVQMGMER